MDYQYEVDPDITLINLVPVCEQYIGFLKAMERRREDRYSSAAALADDLRRYLAGEPIGSA